MNKENINNINIFIIMVLFTILFINILYILNNKKIYKTYKYSNYIDTSGCKNKLYNPNIGLLYPSELIPSTNTSSFCKNKYNTKYCSNGEYPDLFGNCCDGTINLC